MQTVGPLNTRLILHRAGGRWYAMSEWGAKPGIGIARSKTDAIRELFWLYRRGVRKEHRAIAQNYRTIRKMGFKAFCQRRGIKHRSLA